MYYSPTCFITFLGLVAAHTSKHTFGAFQFVLSNLQFLQDLSPMLASSSDCIYLSLTVDIIPNMNPFVS